MGTIELQELLSNKCNGYNAVVLKGFDFDTISNLSENYELIEREFIENNQLCLDKVNTTAMSRAFMVAQNQVVMSYEAFILLSSEFTNIGKFKKIIVLINNLITRYENCTNVTIPDFDGSEFRELGENSLFSNLYSFCSHENDKQYVQYNFPERIDDIDYVDIYEPKALSIVPQAEENLLPLDDNSIENLCYELNKTGKLSKTNYLIEIKDRTNVRLETLNAAAERLGIALTFSLSDSETKHVEVRAELLSQLKETWGYDSFRDLDIYTDLRQNHNVGKISQGEVIETVVRQCENSLKDEQVRHILLTSPTGAGKSLLFQMSAIYMAKHYGCVTIVVSPLVALMEDQVASLKTRYRGVAAINGNRTPQEKEDILNEVRNGSVSLLYLAPELLLSYSIKSFLDERRLGLLVIDEAHTVTTWGRDFRVDYWFLGDHIRSMRNALGYNFPIFALTATAVWDLSGENDMVFDTIASLHMEPCTSYIGVVKRSNISFDIQQADLNKTSYDRQRKDLTIKRIKEFIDQKKKTIAYFPFRRNMEYIVTDTALAGYDDKITHYDAKLSSEEKKKNSQAFKDGKKLVMCATKAFGMGVDVSDIEMVYHHAPSGTLADYVQEIGRAARDPRVQGIAKLDFNEKDFKYMNILHGLSAIQMWQVRAVLKKLMAIYRLGKEKRNMLISSDDFDYIFPLCKDQELDQKVKSCLMLISHDFQKKFKFNAVIVRPKSMFSKCYVQVPVKKADEFYSKYKKYLTPVTAVKGIYTMDADRLWNEKYNNMSFAFFKNSLASGKIFEDYAVQMRCRINLNPLKGDEMVLKELNQFFVESENVLEQMRSEGHRYSKKNLMDYLKGKYGEVKAESMVRAFELVYTSEKAIGTNSGAICKLYMQNDNEKAAYQFSQGSYSKVSAAYMSCFQSKYNDLKFEYYCGKDSNEVKLCELLECLNLIDFDLKGGDSPMIFVRINNPGQLNQLVRSNSYENEILKEVQLKFEYAKKVFMKFFTTKMTDTERWDFIENYFLGTLKV